MSWSIGFLETNKTVIDITEFARDDLGYCDINFKRFHNIDEAIGYFETVVADLKSQKEKGYKYELKDGDLVRC